MFIASIVSLQIVSMAILVWTVSFSVTDAGGAKKKIRGHIIVFLYNTVILFTFSLINRWYTA